MLKLKYGPQRKFDKLSTENMLNRLLNSL